MKRACAVPVLAVCLMLANTQAAGQQANTQPAGQQTNTQATKLPATEQASRAGITTCLPAIQKLETWLSANQSGNALAFWDSTAPDTHLFSALLALENQSGNSLANINVMPSPDGQCMVEYTRTGYVAQSCADHLKGLGSNARFVRDLNSRTALIQGQGVQIFLSPAGPKGCLWMNKEIVRQAAAPTKPEKKVGSTKKATAKGTR